MVEIMGRIFARWCFGPGVTNRVGDFFSRHPWDRDNLRPLEEGPAAAAASSDTRGLPKTLREAFAMAKADLELRDDRMRTDPTKPRRIA